MESIPTLGAGHKQLLALAARQRAALEQLLATLSPAELAIPDTIVTLLGPRVPLEPGRGGPRREW